ncbi:unnamed protein product [Phaedon cochleariae]|uniref:Uncharacterized protein n=1 Tax=Phaedon cochleariae TaxID=80249 RepID=A0A9N9X2S9_PHACE|nr:unnamed protein product [Phaedon cochleariae]
MVESTSKCGRHAVCNGETPEKNLMSKRRRHKTVHFGDNLLLQVCTNANLASQVSYAKMEPNVQQLFSFIETVLSAWVAEEGLTSQGEVSEMDEKEMQRRRHKKHCAKVKKLDVRRLVAEVARLSGTRYLGNLRYRHMHWKGNPDAEGCNELFLRKNKEYGYRWKLIKKGLQNKVTINVSDVQAISSNVIEQTESNECVTLNPLSLYNADISKSGSIAASLSEDNLDGPSFIGQVLIHQE